MTLIPLERNQWSKISFQANLLLPPSVISDHHLLLFDRMSFRSDGIQRKDLSDRHQLIRMTKERQEENKEDYLSSWNVDGTWRRCLKFVAWTTGKTHQLVLNKDNIYHSLWLDRLRKEKEKEKKILLSEDQLGGFLFLLFFLRKKAANWKQKTGKNRSHTLGLSLSLSLSLVVFNFPHLFSFSSRIYLYLFVVLILYLSSFWIEYVRSDKVIMSYRIISYRPIQKFIKAKVEITFSFDLCGFIWCL